MGVSFFGWLYVYLKFAWTAAVWLGLWTTYCEKTRKSDGMGWTDGRKDIGECWNSYVEVFHCKLDVSIFLILFLVHLYNDS